MRVPKYWNTQFAANVINAYKSGKLTTGNVSEWEKEYNGGIAPQPSLGTMEILKHYLSK